MFKKICDLSFNFTSGACTVARDDIYLAFGTELENSSLPSKLSYRASEPTDVFNKINNSLYEHSNINIASSDTNVLACGHGIYKDAWERKVSTAHKKCEFLNLNYTTWIYLRLRAPNIRSSGYLLSRSVYDETGIHYFWRKYD